MGYVDSNLISGENIVYQTKLHKIIFLPPVILALFIIAFAFWLPQSPYSKFNPSFNVWCIALFIYSIIFILPCFIQYLTSEYAITNKRVVAKNGLIQRDIKENFVGQIEAIDVDQSILGRILNFGNVSITGTGGTRETFRKIANPLVFRRYIQEQSELAKRR